MVRLYGVSDNLDFETQYLQLVPFDNDAFNEELEECLLEDTLTDFVNDLYGHEDGCFWFGIGFDDDDDDNMYFRHEIGDNKCVEILNIIDLIDYELDSGTGIFQYFIAVNGSHTEYQWIVAASQGTVFFG